ncbi:transglutaminase-like domain-containing protein [Acetobacterium malicum]|uniref:transglutaminase-like domain-containing protein n=1 Tax=Acetobacterium malicum TaxID=52692 RepID=UPI0003FC1F4B|nr:transglutaminase family protein [Acetobacterium dehalogenans]
MTQKFLLATDMIDYHHIAIQNKIRQLFTAGMNDIDKSRAAYVFVRDQVSHSFDCNAQVITAKASDVLIHQTGICHAKANLLAALLRSQAIPTGFCFQHLTLADDDSLGYCVHAYNAVYLENRWIRLDARGNKPAVEAQFSLSEPILAFANRREYDEYDWPGIYANPHQATMQRLEKAGCLQDILDNIPDTLGKIPDLLA